MNDPARKSETAFKTIGELAGELRLPQHILRYWETRFPQLRPLQRAGNRRYYRPSDVALARRIDKLLNQEGYTVKGVQKLLAGGEVSSETPLATPVEPPSPPPAPAPPQDDSQLLVELKRIRERLARALDADDLAARV